MNIVKQNSATARQVTIGIFCVCIVCFGNSYLATAASCPNSKKYAAISYNHFLRNYYAPGGYIFDQVATIHSTVGIKIIGSGVENAGNNEVDKQISQFNSTPHCDCLSDKYAQSWVKVTVTGTCSTGILNLHIHEDHPESSVTMVCTGDSTCSSYTQPYLPSTADFDLQIPYIDGYTVTKPYTCTNCSGNYSWQLKFTDGPVPFHDSFSLVPLISPLILNH